MKSRILLSPALLAIACRGTPPMRRRSIIGAVVVRPVVASQRCGCEPRVVAAPLLLAADAVRIELRLQFRLRFRLR